MARSKHTVPPRLRAPRRVRDPFAPRGVGDRRAGAASVRAASERGWVPVPYEPSNRGPAESPLPRIRRTEPRPGFCHPIGAAEITAELRTFGEVCTYGLRDIILAQRPWRQRPSLQFGLLQVPGRIVLYEQASPPWTIAGGLAADVAARLRRAGATIETSPAGLRTIVDWPGETLRDFFRFDVLMHEVGHHMIQQYRGKRTLRLMRTRDHEAFADRFAQRCRARCGQRSCPEDAESPTESIEPRPACRG